MKNNGTRERINALMAYKGNGPVVSLYLKLGPHERAGLNYKITFKNLLRSQMERLEKGDLPKADVERIKKIMGKVKNFVDLPSNLEGCGGLALFAGDNLFEVFKLPYSYMDRLVVDTNPLTRGLAAMTDEIGTIYVVALDSKKAMFFRVEAADVDEVEEVKAPEVTALSGERPGMTKSRNKAFSSHSFDTKQRVMRDETQRFYKAVADKLFERFKKERFDWLVIIGPGREDLENHLHAFLAERLLGTAPGEMKNIGANFIKDVIAELMEAKKSQWEKEVLEEFRTKRVLGLTTSGIEKTLEALHNGQIRILIVKKGYSLPGFRNPDGSLLLAAQDGAYPLPDLVDEMMEECLAQKAEVFVTQNEELAKEADNIGAILRFRL